MLRSLRAVVGRLVAVYDRSITRSHASVRGSEALVDGARARFEAPATSRDRRPWCARCGERLRVHDDVGASARDGIHARCYGS